MGYFCRNTKLSFHNLKGGLNKIKMAKSVIDWIALILLIIGGLNWGLTVFDFNLVSTIFGAGTLAKVVYGLVGIAALWTIYFLFKE